MFDLITVSSQQREEAVPSAHVSGTDDHEIGVSAAQVGAGRGPRATLEVSRCAIREKGRLMRSAALRRSVVLRFEERKQNHIADRFRTGKQHREAIDPEAESTGGRHAVLESEQKFLVDVLPFFAGLFE